MFHKQRRRTVYGLENPNKILSFVYIEVILIISLTLLLIYSLMKVSGEISRKEEEIQNKKYFNNKE